MRVILFLVGLVLLTLGIGFAFRLPWALMCWPWEDGKLSYLFLASICASTAIPVIWIAWTKEYAGIKAGALDFAVTYAGLLLTLVITYPLIQEWLPPVLAFTLCTASLLLNLWLYWWSKELPFKYHEPVPLLIRFSFILFLIALVIVGTSLVLRLPHIFPWPLKPQTSIVFGWIYLGAAMYFLYGLLYPVWGNVKGQLAGFLAYDLVLIWPFIQHLSTVKSEHQWSLYIYLLVLIYSVLLSIYYLFIYPPSRLFFNRKIT
ncbi:MAG: hypothetical protein E6Q83_05225 [Thiothrix sp.]|nr:MAG: hypothetical protein E6Q83_05225 [Thiothrix sp.]